MKRYILSIDQSTQSTKVMLFDETGKKVARTERHSASDSLCVGCGRAFRLRCSVRSRVFLRII